jgi:hypothetical protein
MVIYNSALMWACEIQIETAGSSKTASTGIEPAERTPFRRAKGQSWDQVADYLLIRVLDLRGSEWQVQSDGGRSRTRAQSR